MTDSRRLPAWVWVLIAIALPALSARAQPPDILITSPSGGKPAFGEVEVSVEVLAAEEIATVELRVDGKTLHQWVSPPFRTVVDVGQDNVEHRFEIVARTRSGSEGTALRVTPAIAVDDELDLELQQLYVTVRDAAGRRVTQLPQNAFRVVDDDAEQSLVTFQPGNVPFTAAILVDASTSMRGGRLRRAITGAESFVRGMEDLDEASLLLFSDRLLYRTPFSGDAGAVNEALATVEAAGGTAINDHLYLALKSLEGRQGRRVVILLTDGVDIESALSMEDVRWMARRSQALVYWIRLVEKDMGTVYRSSSWRNPREHERELAVLQQVVEESGGRVLNLDRLEGSPEVFREILKELREQYVLGYYPSSNHNDGAWHAVKVRVRNFSPGAVRTREGYIDF